MRVVKLFLSTVTVLAMMGCSSDVIQVLEHPTTVKPGSVIKVKLSSAYVYGIPGKNYWSDISRDSLHVLFGLPEGWSIESVDFYAAKHFEAAKVLAGDQNIESAMNGEYNGLYAGLEDSLALFESRKEPMPANSALDPSLSGRTINARPYEPNGTEIEVAADDVPTWTAYSSSVDLSYQAGSKTDTFTVLDENMKQMIQQYSPELTLLPDTVGVTAVPFFVYATIRTGEQPGEYQLYYYSKTNSVSEYSDMDQGSMTYVPVVLDPQASVRSGIRTVPNGSISAVPAVFSASTKIQLPFERSPGARIDIISLSGRIVGSYSDLSTEASFFVWDGTGHNGGNVESGTYVIRYMDEQKNISSCKVRKVR
ncbi:MAG: hypothetical protein ACLFQB_07905 [Chitinispirillaceae bacterium]